MMKRDREDRPIYYNAAEEPVAGFSNMETAYFISDDSHPEEAGAINEVREGAEPASGWPARQQEDALEALILELKLEALILELKKYDIPSDIDTQPLIPSEFPAALIDTKTYPSVTKSDAGPFRFDEIVPRENERWVFHKARSQQGIQFVVRIGALLVVLLCLGWASGALYQYFDRQNELTSQAGINVVVEKIIAAESMGDPNAKSSHSSATGPGQFLNDTWLDLIREYRPDLTKGRSESETLELRREAKLAREITARFVEHNAAVLRQRGLPVTPGAIYLAHFAGTAGAVAILSAPDNADAAIIMARADATGRTKREQLIKANPFLEHFTVADLKTWADRKMQGPGLHLTQMRAAEAKQ